MTGHKKDLFDTQEEPITVSKENIYTESYKKGDLLKCPVCGKIFKYSEDCKYVVHHAYTCSWKCFMDFNAQHVKDFPGTPAKENKRVTPRVILNLPPKNHKTSEDQTETNPIQTVPVAQAPIQEIPEVQSKKRGRPRKNTTKEVNN